MERLSAAAYVGSARTVGDGLEKPPGPPHVNESSPHGPGHRASDETPLRDVVRPLLLEERLDVAHRPGRAVPGLPA